MQATVWRSAAALALGAGLLVAGTACGGGSGGGSRSATPPARPTSGGTMKLNMSGTDVDFTDPSLAYGSISWQIEYATALKLYNYPDKPAPEGSKLQPEAATGFPVVSRDGKTYTITVRKGLRFSDGRPVTAKNFAFAINRALNPAMQSPATAFTGDIVGADAVLAKKAKTARGVVARGNQLIIKLTQPDGGLLAKLGMPFFQALETTLPTNPRGVNAYPSAGPYYIAGRDVGRQIVVRTNPYYRGNRPHNVDTFVIAANTNLDQSLLQVKANQVDYDMGGLPSTAHSALAREFGVNKDRYQVHPLVETDYVALNTTAGRTFSETKLRKAANFAIDRPAMLRVRGAFSGKATDQILPPGMGGFQDGNIYPLTGADFARAKHLAGGSCKHVNLWTANTTQGQNLGQVFKYDLEQIGCKVDVRLFAGFQIYTAAGARGADFDAALVGWNQDYPDPYDFLDVLLNGKNIRAQNNNNLAYFNVPAVNRKLAAANRLTGEARYHRYGRLDVEITRDYAPWASYDNRNERELVSARVGGYVFQPANASADLNTFFLR